MGASALPLSDHLSFTATFLYNLNCPYKRGPTVSVMIMSEGDFKKNNSDR